MSAIETDGRFAEPLEVTGTADMGAFSTFN